MDQQDHLATGPEGEIGHLDEWAMAVPRPSLQGAAADLHREGVLLPAMEVGTGSPAMVPRSQPRAQQLLLHRVNLGSVPAPHPGMGDVRGKEPILP